jgi:carbamoylphosphate synthase large subunit
MKSKLQTLRDLLYEREEKHTVFGEQPAPLSIDDKKSLAANLSSFSTMAETLRARGQRLEEAVTSITKMVETANRMIQESDDDMVEKVAAGRHMKMVEMALKEMQKSAGEVMIQERRMEAACEDIREGLSKYYEVR